MADDETQPIGVLLMAYGTPNTPEEIEPYYTDVRGGRPPTPELLAQLQARYQQVGGRTPLLDITRAQAKRLEVRLNDDEPGRYSKVYVGMKHWHPYIEEALRQMAADGIREAVAVALAPHYSRMSIGGYIERIEKAQAKLAAEHAADAPAGAHMPIHFTYVESWHDELLFSQALEHQVRAARMAKFPDEGANQVFVVFTAHSLPQKIKEWNDPYKRELLATSAGVAGLLALPRNRWDFAFQSAGRTSEPWLGPDILEKVRELAARGERCILICPVGFISDHLEILYDIDIECRDLAKELGIHLERIEMLNADASLIAALASVVERHTSASTSAP
ncbi:MAG: ferrochelatase [Ktedonobacterales bacterium]